MSLFSSAANPSAIDSPDMRKAGRELLSLALMDARNHTLSLAGFLEQAPAVARPPADRLDPPWWVAGHTGWFAEYWIGRNTRRSLGKVCPADAVRLASIEPQADRWWDPALAASAERWRLELPAPEAVRAYLLETLEGTLDLLEKTPDEPEALYFYRLALFHEDLRSEQLVTAAQTLGMPLKLDLPGGVVQREALLMQATHWMLGSQPTDGFCPDNEQPAHGVPVPEFEIDAQTVNWSQYLEFVDDGGYDRAELWHPAGWAWLQALGATEGRRGPRHVEQISVASGAVLQTRFGKATRMAGNQAVMHVTWWEADAWCRWAGRRLPLELEWEVAAHQAARRGFLWGQVWEWTANSFYAYPGFASGPWASYSTPHFSKTRVLRGASFATRSRLKHPRFRGFALPGWDQGFVGFRSCAL
jgi:ergothioneine biosynthesis protein EgtB